MNSQPVEPLRHGFRDELDQLRIQVELMGVRVDENLERMRENLRTGDEALAETAFIADDEIDAMNVSLTERCYLLLAASRRWHPTCGSSCRCCGSCRSSSGSATSPCAS